jgi:hypothetical protein
MSEQAKGKHSKVALVYGILAFWVDPGGFVVVGLIMTADDLFTRFNSLA